MYYQVEVQTRMEGFWKVGKEAAKISAVSMLDA
jgi:hypothetical protein